MKEIELLGEIMWEVNNLEARRLWREKPDDRWRLITHEEVDAHLLDGPDQIREWQQKKRDKPGQYL